MAILNGSRHPLKHGYYVTKQPGNQELKIKLDHATAREKEEQFFSTDSNWANVKECRDRMGGMNGSGREASDSDPINRIYAISGDDTGVREVPVHAIISKGGKEQSLKSFWSDPRFSRYPSSLDELVLLDNLQVRLSNVNTCGIF